MIDEARLLARFQALCAIDNPSGHERGVCDALIAALSALGIPAEEDRAGDALNGNAGNLLARVPGTLPGPPLLFAAHMDSVPPACGKRALLQPDGVVTSDGNTVLGADDLAGVAAILEALTSLRESGAPHRSLELLFTVQEERYGAGAAQLDTSRLHAREAYVLDLTGPTGQAAFAAPSLIRFRADFTGRAAHAGLAPEQGISAIQAAARAVAALPLGRQDGVTLNVGTIGGGTADNTVPAESFFTGEVRSFDGEAAAALALRVRAAAEQAAQQTGAAVCFSAQTLCQAWSVPEDAPVCRRFTAQCAALGLSAELVRLQSGSDNGALSRAGLQGLVLAVGKYRGHTCAEYLSIPEFVSAARLTEALMCAEDAAQAAEKAHR